MPFIFAFLTIFLGWAMVANSADKGLYPNCNVSEQQDDKSLSCAFRAGTPETVKRASLLANGTKLEGSTFTSFVDGDDKAAWLFLIDRSNPKRAKTVTRSVELVKRLYANANARNIMSVATFAGDMQVLVSPGDPYADIDERLKNIKANGAATAFYLNALQGIEILEQVDAKRRALVIISDGKAEDTAYFREDVTKRAKKAGVVIYGIGFAEKPSETVKLQPLQWLAEQTGGPFVEAVAQEPLPADFIENFATYLTNGGSVVAPLGDISGELTARLEVAFTDGTMLSSEAMNLYIEPPAPEPEPEPEIAPEPEPQPLPLIGKIYTSFEGVASGATEWAVANSGLAWLMLAMPFIIALAVILYLLVGKAESKSATDEAVETDEPVTPKTETIQVEDDDVRTTLIPNAPTLGYFETLDGKQHFDIREQNVTIGRHSENDFQLDDETVHRHHAVFHMSPEKRPVITDLDTVNGIVVNGKRVAKIELSPGDIIELGEARFKFDVS